MRAKTWMLVYSDGGLLDLFKCHPKLDLEQP